MGSKWAALGMLPASPHIRAGPSSHRFYTSHLSLMGTVLFFLFPEKTVCRGRWLWLVASVWPGTPSPQRPSWATLQLEGPGRRGPLVTAASSFPLQSVQSKPVLNDEGGRKAINFKCWGAKTVTSLESSKLHFISILMRFL